MTLSRHPFRRGWSPWAEIEAVGREMERRIGAILGGDAPLGGAWAPDVDIVEEDGALVVRVDLPGVNKDDVEVVVEEESLTIKGERKVYKEVQREGFWAIERAGGTFMRVLPLPAGVKTTAAKAELRDGVLEIRIPKAPSDAEGRRIDID